jgi:hypothetical protein
MSACIFATRTDGVWAASTTDRSGPRLRCCCADDDSKALGRSGRDQPPGFRKQTFNHPAQQIVFQDQLEVINAAQFRLAALEQQLREIVPT